MGSMNMKRATIVLTASVISAVSLSYFVAFAQSPELEQKMMAIKQASAENKQKLAMYSWQETETISIKGNVKDTKVYQVHMMGGQQQKVLMEDAKAAAPSGGRMKQRVIANKTEEYQEYGQSIGALAKQYTTPNPDLLMQAKQAGNVSFQPGAGTISLVIKNYLKPGDAVTMTLSEQTHAPVSVQISSYLSDPSDVVTIAAQFAQLPDGTNHVSTTNIDGVSKQLTINEQNANYQKM
jgi:hypothetical protein